MYDLSLDDDTKTLNRKYGYNNTVAVLKAQDFDGFAVVLLMHVDLKYFRNGRACMHVVRKYSVRCESADTRGTSFDKNWIPTKAEASKYYRDLIKQFKAGA